MGPSDENLRNSFEIALAQGIAYEFIEADLGYQHPNTVKIVFKSKDKRILTLLGHLLEEVMFNNQY